MGNKNTGGGLEQQRKEISSSFAFESSMQKKAAHEEPRKRYICATPALFLRYIGNEDTSKRVNIFLVFLKSPFQGERMTNVVIYVTKEMVQFFVPIFIEGIPRDEDVCPTKYEGSHFFLVDYLLFWEMYPLSHIKQRIERMGLLLVLLVCLVIVFLLIGTGLCWYIANRLLRRTSGTPARTISVVAFDKTRITLKKTKNTRRPGTFGIQGSEGQAIVGPIVQSDEKTITREVLSLKGALFPTEKVGWNTTIYGGKLLDSLGLPMQQITIPGPDNYPLPAWFTPGKSTVWAILIHGATATQEQTLRASKTLAQLDVNLIAISYRGDKGASASLSHLGATEWQDVEPAVQYALAQGAQQIILCGWSLGGTIVETFLDHSPLAKRIQAVVLDSPVLSWKATLKALTKKNKLPGIIAKGTETVIAWRTGVRLADLDQIRPNKQQPQPTLLFHGEADSTAPIHVSALFAEQQPNVTWYRVPDAEHTQCWNANPQQYEEQLRSFLSKVFDALPTR